MGSPLTIEEHESELEELRGRVKELDNEYAGQQFPDDAKARYNADNEAIDEKVAVIEELRARQDRVKQLAGDPEAREAGALFHTQRPGVAKGTDIYDLTSLRAMSPDAQSGEMRDRVMRSVETAQFPHERANREDAQAHIESLIERFAGSEDDGFGGGQLQSFARRVLTTGSPVYKRAFGKALSGRPLTPEEQRSLSLTAASGGYAVPYVLDPTIIPTSNSVVNPMRAISRIETISGANTWKGVSSGAITASRDSEETEVSDDSPTLAQPVATVTKVQAFIPFSVEVGGDWGALQSEMAMLLQDSKDDEEAASFVTGSGNGVTAPQGVVAGTTGTVAAGTAAFAVAHLYALEEALAPRFRPRAQFIGNRAQYNRVRQFDTAGGANLWVTNLQQGLNSGVPTPGNTGAQLLGYTANEASAMASVLTAASKILILGDFRYFLIVDRVGMDIELIPHVFGASGRPTGQRGLWAWWRNTSVTLAASAFKALVTT